MRVLQINATYGVGSTGQIVKSIHELLLRNKYESFVAYQYCSEKPKNGYRIGNLIDWKMHALYTRISGKQGYASKMATKKFLKWVDSVNPDVVHLHNLHANYINLPMLCNYLAKKDIATVITLHDCWFFTGKCFHFVESNCEKWKTGCGNCPRNKKDIKSLFFDRTHVAILDKKNIFDNIKDLTIVGCSDWISQKAQDSGVLHNRCVVTIRNGVDLSVFKPTEQSFREKYGLKDKFIVLGMANKWLNKDNYDTVRHLAECFTNDIVVVLIGCKKDQIS